MKGKRICKMSGTHEGGMIGIVSSRMQFPYGLE